MKVTLLNKATNAVTGDIIRTFQLDEFPKPFLGELAKHRVCSISAESSRARPIEKVMEQVRDNPYVPNWTANQKGMSGLFMRDQETPGQVYQRLKLDVLAAVRELSDLGVHKQDANRILEPFMFCSVVVTGTEWENFYKLRTAENVQPALKEIATEMRRIDQSTKPKELGLKQWYRPYPDLTVVENVAKIASISYARHNKDLSFAKAQELYSKLLFDEHLVPFEHVSKTVCPGTVVSVNAFQPRQVFDTFHMEKTLAAAPFDYEPISTGNFAGFLSLRRILGF